MARKRPGRKVRVDFRQNRQAPRRAGDLTRRYRSDEDAVVDSRQVESVRAKGELSRKRTVIVDEAEAPRTDESSWRGGVVTRVHGLIAFVDESGQEWECTVRRILRTLLIESRSPVAVGDRVWFSDQSATAGGRRVGVIERVEPRRTRLSRRERRGREHTIVANADQLLIVASVAQPRLKPHLIDRYIVAAHKGELTPIVCFTKCDLLDFPEDEMPAGAAPAGGSAEDPPDCAAESGAGGSGEAGSARAPAECSDEGRDAPDEGDEFGADDAFIELDDAHPLAVYEELSSIGYRCLFTSVHTGQGLDELRAALAGHMTVLSGQSGVGKSSLINAIEPGLDLAVANVSEENEKGRHTTTHANLLRLSSGGYVVDTPGIRSFDLWSVNPGELEALFIEFAPRVQNCRFSDCTHRHEEGCAIQAAVAAGEISPRRYHSYLKMFHEV